MNILKIDFNQIFIIPAEKDNEEHKKRILSIFNENIEFFHLTSDPISYEDHSKWWNDNFDKEYIYLIIFENEILGYIRLTKIRTDMKEKNEISIALLKKYQNTGIGSAAYKLFENEVKKVGIDEIIANTEIGNKKAQKFFVDNNFSKSMIKYHKKL